MASPMDGADRLETRLVRDQFGDSLVKVKEYRGDTWLCVSVDKVIDVLKFLRDHPALQYNYFSECVGADYSAWTHARDMEGRFEVTYNLMSLKHHSRIFVKTAVNEGTPIPTAIHVYAGAEYPEREIMDLYGVVFEGNTDHPGRFLLPDDWIGHPLRKEYPLGGEDVVFDQDTKGPAVEDISMPFAGSSFEGSTGTERVSGR